MMFKNIHLRISHFDFPHIAELKENHPKYYINHKKLELSNKRAKPEVKANELQLNTLNLYKYLSKCHEKQGPKWHVFIVRVK